MQRPSTEALHGPSLTVVQNTTSEKKILKLVF